MKSILIFLFAFFGAYIALGQTPLLERKISIAAANERLAVSLKRISEAGGFIFSYNPEALNDQRMVSFNFVDKSIREVLDGIFSGSVRYKTRGKYIILTRSEQQQISKEPAIISGYVVDEATGERLRDVSIYDPVTLSSTITDSYGYFQIKIDRPSPDLILSVNRKNYNDTLVVVPSRERLLNIPIRIDRDKITTIADSVGIKMQRFWEKQVRWFENLNFENIDDTLYRTTQVSFVPFVGTNHKLSGHVINDYSFNVLGGYALGVRKLEIGGLFNLERGDMSGVQFAGLFNGVGGKMTGVQFAGIMNGNGAASQGAQFAGVLNLGDGEMGGPQFAGVGNITNGTQKGPQVAGVFNLSTRDNNGAQIAGVFNISAKTMTGLQSAGVFNLSGKNIRGVQLAGVMNVTGKDIRGAQIAGVLNVARKVKGTQIGLINIADSVKGVPVGLLSLVFKGYHKIEISADEIFYHNLAFRTGVRKFYNILTAGAKPSSYREQETIWTFGYGVGTAPRLSRKLFLNVDLTSNQIVRGNSFDGLNLLNKFYLGIDYQAFRKMSLAFGATLNGHIIEKAVDTYAPLFTDYAPEILYSRDLGSSHHLKMWVGGKVALRFL